MDKNTEKINLLLLKLENLLARQQVIETEVKALREEVWHLQHPHEEILGLKETKSQTVTPQKALPELSPRVHVEPKINFAGSLKQDKFKKSDFEKFIGENLISKIGILILIIGVGIGTKFAIDKGWVTPLSRIILGYVVGAGLMSLALRLKKTYENYSAVLLSGAMAILYFITYAAYAYYQLLPQLLTFGLMVIFTGFTVIAAIKYNRQVIAHIGLVGAYAVPFLLSDGSGKIVILFTYIAIINSGILILSFSKYWKWLFYSSFTLTWIIFLFWNISAGNHLKEIRVSMIFSTLYFLTFYITNLAYKVGKKEPFKNTDVILILINSFIFYGAGYHVLYNWTDGKAISGLFTLSNAILHFLVCLFISKRKLADKSLFYFILALVITFITIAIPVQFSGNWVSLFWITEAAILYHLGRIKHVAFFERLAFPLLVLAFLSLLQDWFFRQPLPQITPFLNINFLTACIFIIALSAMQRLNRKTDPAADQKYKLIIRVLSFAIPSILIFVSYFTFRIEIELIFQNLAEHSKTAFPNGKYAQLTREYELFSIVFVYGYSLLFAGILTFINVKKIKSSDLALANLIINLLIIIIFLTDGLLRLTYLRQIYLGENVFYVAPGENLNIDHSPFHIWIRYLAYLFFGLLILSCYQLSKSSLIKAKLKTSFDYLLYVAILWLLSSELLNILELQGLKTGYKLGLSILWGTYALLMISIGMWKSKKYLRIGAIVLFAVTLLKVFLYDLTSLNTLAKTVVFVSLGILLLIISFLYNKYKDLITDHEA